MADTSPLSIPVPPMLEAALGYDGTAQLVAFFWSPAGDEARFADGRTEADADWFAFRVFCDAPAITAALISFDLGSSETRATHWLLLDRTARTLAAVPVAQARAVLRTQWVPDDLLPFTFDDEIDFAALIAALPRVDITMAMQHQQTLVIELQHWLQANLPAPTDVLVQIRASLALRFGVSAGE